jgi:hypothetical protein
MCKLIFWSRHLLLDQHGSQSDAVERVTRIELALSAWEADVLPLNYTRDVVGLGDGSIMPSHRPSANPVDR